MAGRINNKGKKEIMIIKGAIANDKKNKKQLTYLLRNALSSKGFLNFFVLDLREQNKRCKQA
jgi:hypothetical protein